MCTLADMRALKYLTYLAGIALGSIYLLNPGAGAFELIPDYLPIFGHIDEVAAVGLVAACVRNLRSLRAARRSDTDGEDAAISAPPAR